MPSIGVERSRPGAGPRPEGWGILYFCLALYAAQVSQEKYDAVAKFDRLPLLLRSGIMVAGCWAMVLFTPKAVVPFLYFQF